MTLNKFEMPFSAYSVVGAIAIGSAWLTLWVQCKVGAGYDNVMTAIAVATIAAFAAWCLAATSSAWNQIAVGIVASGTWLGWDGLIDDIGYYQAGAPTSVPIEVLSLTHTVLPFYTEDLFKAGIAMFLLFSGLIWNHITNYQ